MCAKEDVSKPEVCQDEEWRKLEASLVKQSALWRAPWIFPTEGRKSVRVSS